MSTHLRSCLQCARHIRITENACPFCRAPVPSARMTAPPRGTPALRLSRAAVLATMTAVGTAGAVVESTACITASDFMAGGPPQGRDEDIDAGDSGGEPIVTAGDAYGVAPLDTGAPDVLVGMVGAAYGVATILPDAGDAGRDVEVIVTALDAYGVAPFDEASSDVMVGTVSPAETADAAAGD